MISFPIFNTLHVFLTHDKIPVHLVCGPRLDFTEHITTNVLMYIWQNIDVMHIHTYI